MTVSVIKTKHKPLTKGWDTAELAGPQDVEVLVDGHAVPVQEVDPLRGRITLEDPLPKGAGLGVEVKYFYLGGPLTFDYAFHKEGWGLNQFAAHPDQFWETPHTKMPMVPSAVRRRQPALLGKTYTAFQRAYTASLNDPTTLLFNEVPSVYGGMRRKLNPFSLLWEGDKTPPESEWRQSGGGGGGGQHPSFEEGLFIIEDDSTSDDVVSSEPYFYGATADFTYAYSLTLNFRMKIFGFQPDGDFTGIAAGYAGDKRLAFLGFLVKDDFHFAGFLGLGGDETCWQSYHGIPAVLEADGLGRTLSFQNPVPVVAGQRIMVGASGEIRIVEAVLGHTVLVDQPFQELLPGQGTEVFVSLDYGELTSYRIYRDAETGLTKAFASGTTAPFAVLRDQDRPQSPEIYELLRANEVFFGSLSRRATNKTGWAFYRLGIMPQNPTQQQMEVAVETPFTVLPQDEGDPRQAWTLTDNQGYALLEPSSGKTVIQQAGSDTRGSFAYHRLEPFLTDQTSIVLEAGWRVYHSEAPMPWHLTVSDGRKEVTLCLFTSPDEGPTWVPIFDPPTLTGTSGGTTLITGGHVPGDSGLPLITTGHLGGGPSPEEGESSGSLPLSVGNGAGVLSTKGQWPGDTGVPITTKGQVEDFQDFAAGLRGDGFRMNFPGVRTFEEEGWAQDFDANIDIDFRDHALILKKTAPNPGGGGDKATKTIPFPSGNVPVSNYITSFRLRVHEAETDALVFQVDDGENDIRIAFSRTTGGEACLRFIDEAQNDYVRDGTTGHILEVLWPWDEGNYHAYRVRRHNTLLSIFIDGAFQAWFDLKHFPQSQRVNSALTGLLLGAGAVHLELDFWFLHANEYGKRWVGLYKGGGHLYDPGSYDFIEHDWLNTDFDVRISRDPAGKTVIQFGDKSFERQYHELPDTLPRPLVNTSLGYVCFGAMQPGTHAYVRCHHLNYVIRNKPAKRRTLTQSVFNRAWPVASPEYVYDEDPETFEVPVREGNKVYLSSLGIRARRIIAVQTKEGDSPDFTFDPKANEIALENVPLEDGPEVVFVTLLHGRPYGKRYLKNQEVPVTRLNEGTPTFWASQRKQLQIDKRLLTDPDVDWPGAITLEDGQYKVTYVTGPDNFYESLNIDTELLAGQQEQNLLFPACDTGGWIQLDMWGTPGELQDIYEMPAARDICPRPLPLFLLDKDGSLLDSEEAGLAKSSSPQCDVQFDVVMSLDETLGTTPQETFVEGQIVFYEGLLLDVSDKSLDDPEDLMDTSEAQPPQPILF